MSRFIAHSSNEEAVRQVRKFNFHLGAALATTLVTFFALLLRLASLSEPLSEGANAVLNIGCITLTALATIAMTTLVAARFSLGSYLKEGTIVRVDDSTAAAYDKVTKKTGTNDSLDELFDRQTAMNAESRRQDSLHCERHGRREMVN